MSSNVEGENTVSYEGFVKKERMSGKVIPHTSDIYIYLPTDLSDLWLSTSRTDCRITRLCGYLSNIFTDIFVTVVENTAAKIFSFRSYRVAENPTYESQF